MYMDKVYRFDIGGVPQSVAVSAEHRDTPLLLYVHGGPGVSVLPLVHKYNLPLAERFTLAVWEQRGSGKSYYKFSLDEALTVGTFLDDLHQLIQGLLETFGQEKLYLTGHSWGSILGLQYVNSHPHHIYAYVGCGQIVNMRAASRQAYMFALQNAISSGQLYDIQKLKKIDYLFKNEDWYQDLCYLTKMITHFGGAVYQERSFYKYMKIILCSPVYSVRDKLNIFRGCRQTVRQLWPELMQTKLDHLSRFDIPVVFIEGQDDAYAQAKAFYDNIETEKQFYLFQKSGRYPQWSEPDKFHQILFDLLAGTKWDENR